MREKCNVLHLHLIEEKPDDDTIIEEYKKKKIAF